MSKGHSKAEALRAMREARHDGSGLFKGGTIAATEQAPAILSDHPIVRKNQVAAREAAKTRQQNREGKRQISVWVDDAVHKHMKVRVAEAGVTIEAYIASLIESDWVAR